MNVPSSVHEEGNTKIGSDGREVASSSHSHDLRPRNVPQEGTDKDVLLSNSSLLGTSQRKQSSKLGKSRSKPEPGRLLPEKYEAQKIEGVAPTIKLSMNYSFASFVEGMKRSDFNTLLGAIKQVITLCSN